MDCFALQEPSLSQHDVQNHVKSQIKLSQLRENLTIFLCTSCSDCNLTTQSPDYLMVVAQMKNELQDLIGIIRDFLLDWPLFCDCTQKLAAPLTKAVGLLEYLFESYPYAYSVNGAAEKQAIAFFEVVYKDAYKLHMIFIHTLKECKRGHSFLNQYNYEPQRCCVCRQQNVSTSRIYQDVTVATTPPNQPSCRKKLLENMFCCHTFQQDTPCAQSVAHTTPVAHKRPLHYTDLFDPDEIDEVDSVY